MHKVSKANKINGGDDEWGRAKTKKRKKEGKKRGAPKDGV